MRYISTAILAIAVIVSGVGAAWGDELAEQGRAILEKHKDSVVTIKLVINQQFSMSGFGSQEQESKDEVTGTVIDPSGLTVVALSATDPTSMIQSMMEMSGEDTQGLQMSSQVTDLKILLADGSEIPGQVVLRDKDLDLAFVRPTDAPKEPMPAVDLKNIGVPQVLDPLFTINRMGRVAGREYACSIERIDSVVTKPRTFYIPGNDPTQTGLGSPAFTTDGKLVGVLVMRTAKGAGSVSSMMRGQNSSMAVIVPTEDIAEVAAQAPAVGVESKEVGTTEESKEAEKAEKAAAPADEAKEAPAEEGAKEAP